MRMKGIVIGSPTTAVALLEEVGRIRGGGGV